MSNVLKKLKQRLKENQQKGGNRSGSHGDFYDFWNMKAGDTAKVRILLDPDEINDDLFLRYKYEHKISINGEEKRILCPYNQYDQHHKCPICELSNHYYKSGDEKTGKYYYRNKSAIAHGVITEDPLDPDAETGENAEGKYKVLSLTYQPMSALIAAAAADDMEDEFWDLDEGVDFIIRKTEDGEYASYHSSNFARKASSIPKDWRNFEPKKLSDFIGPVPTTEEVQALLNLHLGGEGEPDADEQKDSTPATTESAAASIDKLRNKLKQTDDAPAEEDPPFDEDDGDDDMDDDEVAAILNRRRAS